MKFHPFRREPRRLHAEDMQLIFRRIEEIMSDAENRITASVARIVADAATEIRNHPAAQDDSGALNALADKLDAASTSLEAENPAPAAPADPAPAADPNAPAA